MVQVILTSTFWILYAMFEGTREGLYWHWKNQVEPEKQYHEHSLWTWQRGVVLIVFAALAGSPWFVLSGMLLFPLVHDGAYYIKRDKLVPGTYPERWLDHSSTSTAFWTKYMPPRTRIACFVIGSLLNGWIISMDESIAIIFKLY